VIKFALKSDVPTTHHPFGIDQGQKSLFKEQFLEKRKLI